jgi:hypothetical protein
MFRDVKHDLLGLKDAATLRVAGPAEAEHLVYLQAGFPCDHSSLEPLAARLASECGCLVGVGCMPEYDREVPLRPEGYDMEQLLACFSQAVDALTAQSSRAPSARLTLVVHDWGCAPGFMYSNTAGCDKLVAFDVLLAKKPDRLYYALNHLHYQGHFALAFKVRVRVRADLTLTLILTLTLTLTLSLSLTLTLTLTSSRSSALRSAASTCR